MSQSYNILLVEDNPINIKIVEKLLENGDVDYRVTHADSLVSALDWLSHERFDIALVDLGLPDSQGIDTFLAIQRHAPDVPVVVLTGSDSDSIGTRAMELGAQDFLTKGSLTSGGLMRALQYGIIRNRNTADSAQTAKKKARVIAFIGAKGGVGVTTLACQFARQLKLETGEEILLTGTGASSGTLAFLMGLEAKYTMLHASMNLHRLDADLWRSLVCATPSGLDVLSPPGSLRLGEILDGERVRHVLRMARSLYDWIVLDLGTIDPVSLSLIGEIQELYTVSTLDVLALREAGRLRSYLGEHGFAPEQTRLIINRKKKWLLPQVEIEKQLGLRIDGSVREESEELSGFEGLMSSPESRVSKDVAALVRILLGKEPIPEKGLMSRLFHPSSTSPKTQLEH